MAHEKLVQTLNRYRAEYIKAIQRNIQKQDIVASGNLGDSLTIDKQPKIKLFGKVYKMAITMAEYGSYIDKGVSGTKVKYDTPFTFTKQPPVSAIKRWLSRRNVAMKLTGLDQDMTESEIDGLAFGIARNKKLFGIKPRKFLTNAVNEVSTGIEQDITKAIKEDTVLRIDDINKRLKKK